jgi:hypothetical protein
MDRTIDTYIDILVLVTAMILGFSVTIFSINAINSDAWRKLHDKTVLEQKYNQAPPHVQLKGYDVLLMLVVQDSDVPYPASMTINNSTPVKFDADWFASLTSNIQNTYYSSIQGRLQSNIDLTVKNGVWEVKYV